MITISIYHYSSWYSQKSFSYPSWTCSKSTFRRCSQYLEKDKKKYSSS